MCHNFAGYAIYFGIGIWHNIQQGYVERLLFTELLVEVSFVNTLIKSQYFYKTRLISVGMRSALTSSLYRKALLLGPTLRKDFTGTTWFVWVLCSPQLSLRKAVPRKRALLKSATVRTDLMLVKVLRIHYGIHKIPLKSKTIQK